MSQSGRAKNPASLKESKAYLNKKGSRGSWTSREQRRRWNPGQVSEDRAGFMSPSGALHNFDELYVRAPLAVRNEKLLRQEERCC